MESNKTLKSEEFETVQSGVFGYNRKYQMQPSVQPVPHAMSDVGGELPASRGTLG